MAKSLSNGLVGTGFASWYQLQHRADVLRMNGCKATIPYSLSLTITRDTSQMAEVCVQDSMLELYVHISMDINSGQVRSGQVRVFNMHIQSKLL